MTASRVEFSTMIIAFGEKGSVKGELLPDFLIVNESIRLNMSLNRHIGSRPICEDVVVDMSTVNPAQIYSVSVQPE